MFVWVAPSVCAPALSLDSRRSQAWVQHVMMNAALGWQTRATEGCWPVHATLHGVLCSAYVHAAEEKQELILFAE